MSIRKGMVQTPTAQTSTPTRDVQPHTVIGRPVPARKASPPPVEQPSRIVEPNAPMRAKFAEPIVRGMIVGTDGKPIRGLSQATLNQHKEQTEDCTELCTRCGQMRPPAQMKTLSGNAENPNNIIRVCKTECVAQTYRNPYDERERWQPSVPAIRFDRERGQPYNARAAGVTIKDLVNRDTYHNEREVNAEFRQDGVNGEGRWSGGGKVGRQAAK